MSLSPLLAGLSAALLFAGAAAAQPERAHGQAARNELRIVIDDVTSDRGHVRVDVCTRSEFLKDCRYSGAAPATPGVTVVVVRDLPPGVYAVQAYHDQNDNHDVDRDFLGIPREPVGFSNDAPVRLGPPSFKAAAFGYAGGEEAITLRLRRFGP